MSVQPTEIKLHKLSRVLQLQFSDGLDVHLPCEYLRVYSPSAEVRGHGPGQETLQIGKEQVNIDAIEPVGNYAVKLVFDDGHDSGLFSWEYLHNLAINYETNWQDYLQRLEQAGVTRRNPESS